MDEALRILGRLGVVRRDSIERLDLHPDLDVDGEMTRVWGVEVDGPSGTRSMVVKHCLSKRTYEQELVALRQWFGRSHELGGALVPELHETNEPTRTLIMTRMPGTPAPYAEPEVHYAAGRFLAALHRLPIADDDPLPLADALSRRYDSWLGLCRSALTPDERRAAYEHRPHPELFAGAMRVPCHRDFTPHNWLWDGERLSVVDFEHARLDLAYVDLAKLAVGPWQCSRAAASAFFDGYGRPPDESLRHEQLRVAIVLHGIASLAWGREHDDSQFVDEGRRALALAATWR